MTEFRRLRTQAERDADGTTWRPDEGRCTLPDRGTCYCTGRAGCLATNEDAFDDPDDARYTRRNP